MIILFLNGIMLRESHNITLNAQRAFDVATANVVR